MVGIGGEGRQEKKGEVVDERGEEGCKWGERSGVWEWLEVWARRGRDCGKVGGGSHSWRGMNVGCKETSSSTDIGGVNGDGETLQL